MPERLGPRQEASPERARKARSWLRERFSVAEQFELERAALAVVLFRRQLEDTPPGKCTGAEPGTMP